MKGKRPDYIVNITVDLEGGKTRWREVGVAFRSEKDTITVLLDALPIAGRLVLTPPRERETTEPRRAE